MIRRLGDIPVESREGIRGGSGRADVREYLGPGAMKGTEFVSVITLEPGASIGEHEHAVTEEFYYILEGRGTGILDGESFRVGPGDAFLLKEGHTHGLSNDAESPLSFLAILTK